MAEKTACVILTFWAGYINRAIIEVIRDKGVSPARRAVAGEIATHLMLSCHYLSSLPPYSIDPEVEQLCEKLLLGLAGICSWPKSFRPKRLLDDIFRLFNDTLVPLRATRRRHTIVSYFHDQKDGAVLDTIKQDCNQLSKLLCDDEGDADKLPFDSETSKANNYLADLSQDLFKALEYHSRCEPLSPDYSEGHGHKRFHPARLCLSEEHNECPSLNLVVSPMSMTDWQDFYLTIDSDIRAAVPRDATPQPIFCRLVDFPQYARVPLSFCPLQGLFQGRQNQFLEMKPEPGCGERLAGILRDYTLTPRDKIVLAYTMAQAYHNFYDSDLMRVRWSSETIWFMPVSEDGDQIPLRPYLTFPFGQQDDSLKDFVDDGLLVHKHPRIFAIGVLLLEVGLSRPFLWIRRRDYVSQGNEDHRIAVNWHKELTKTPWEGFRFKRCFDAAVKYCFDIQALGNATSSLSTGRPKHIPDSKNMILQRRKQFYKNVVRPLKWLAEEGFRHDIQIMTYIYKSPEIAAAGEASAALPQAEASFLTRRNVIPQRWLDNLKLIASEVERNRRTYKIAATIRIAILDTGFDRGNKTANRIRQYRDFVEEGSDMTDTFGHGTFMARLVMESAPGAQIMVARVARDTTELPASQEAVAEAIRWAGLECQADVISMSFGYPKNHPGIAQSIQTVQSQRNEAIIFLASAGNSSSEEESFPARHPSVISLCATNCHGVFAETNPRLPDDGPAALGIYGCDVPAETFRDISEKYPNVCRPGSSVATAVAAGVSATMLAYAMVLCHTNSLDETTHQSFTRTVELLRRSKGMEAMFKAMVADRNGRRWFVDPVSYWRDTQSPDKKGRETHHMRYSKIHASLNGLNISQH